MSESESESSDEDLIKKILDLRPSPEAASSANYVPDEVIEDPFSHAEQSELSRTIISKKISRRLEDSDESQDDALSNRNGKSKICRLTSLGMSSGDDDANFESISGNNQEHVHNNGSSQRREQPSSQINESTRPLENGEEDLIQEPIIDNRSKTRSSSSQKNDDVKVSGKKKRPIISDESDDQDDDVPLKEVILREKETVNLVSLPSEIMANESGQRSQGVSRRKRPVISDDSEDEQLENDILKTPVQNFKKRRPAIAESEDEDQGLQGRSKLALWQSLGEGAQGEPKQMSSAGSPSKSTVPESDSDESDLDRVILRKHCSAADRRLKYESKPNPDFLDHLLKQICHRSTQIGLELGSSNPQPESADASSWKSDNDSIELEFSDEGERQVYNEHFQSHKSESQPQPSVIQSQ